MDAIGYFHRIVGAVAEMQQGHETGPRWLARAGYRRVVLLRRAFGSGCEVVGLSHSLRGRCFMREKSQLGG